jgi:phosphoribosyl 1,2-cyclic phosphodiesterase
MVTCIGDQRSMQVTFYGVRGSTPCHGDDTHKYGGNTSCVAVRIPGEQPIMFDLGTGARYFGATQLAGQPFRGTCLLSHLHWDHTQGLPFFTPILKPGAELDIYAPQQDDGRPLAEVFEEMICPPVFPVTIAQFAGTVRYHELNDDDFAIGGVKVRSRLVPHLGPTLGFRVEWNGRSVVYMSDHQQPHDGSFSLTQGARDLAEGADLLIHDSQYTAAEFPAKNNWGHCTVDYAIWLARECGVKTLALFHHDPTRTDDALDALDGREVGDGLQLLVAREGLTVELD